METFEPPEEGREMPSGLLLALVGVLLIAIFVGAVLLYRRWLDRHEDWNPWADTMVLPTLPAGMPGPLAVPVQLPGRHRLELLTHPFRLPGWD